MLKESAKSVIRTVSSPFVRGWPIARWPRWLGRIHGVKVPAGLPRQSQAAPTGQANINILIEVIETTKSLSGAIADCGVYKAASTIGMALYITQHGIQKPIYAFDSFQGFQPESVIKDLQLGGVQDEDRHEHGFSDTTLDEVKSKIRRFGINNIHLVPGYFNQSFKTFPRDVTFSLAHLDVNLYDSYRECLEFFYPRIEHGGIILFDEYNDPPWPGCNKAVDEFLVGKPEHLEMICRNNYQKWYFVKQ
jgi:Macrocin-O-methyltransferase (TylF)